MNNHPFGLWNIYLTPEKEKLWAIKHRYNLWKDFLKRNSNRVIEWNSRAREECDREIKNLKIIKLQDTLWGRSLNGNEFAERYGRRGTHCEQ
jgi:hypothetical protein